MSFHHHTIHTVKGGYSYQAGDTLRHKTMAAEWSTHLILGFSETEVKLARPYAYVSGSGTTGPTVLQGCETYSVPLSHLDHFEHLSRDGRFRR